MSTPEAFVWLGIGFVMLIAGAEFLVRGAGRMGTRLGMHPLTVGATIVAFGTSAPEFLVSVVAGMEGEPALALNNLVGSNIANIALVLGLAACVRPIPTDRRVLRIEYPVALLATAAIPALANDNLISKNDGLMLSAGFVAFLLIYVWSARVAAKAGTRTEIPEIEGSGGIPLLLGMAAGGLVLLVFGAQKVVESAKAIALAQGYSEAAVGATVVAFGTSLPEIATSVIAAMRGAHGIAIGNVLGSNVFNLLFVLGPVATMHPLEVGALEKDQLIWIMLALTVLLLPMLSLGKNLSRLEGLVLLASYGGFCWVIWDHIGGI